MCHTFVNLNENYTAVRKNSKILCHRTINLTFQGLRKMHFLPPLRFAREDFDRMTLEAALCGPDGTIGPVAFEGMLRTELLR